MPKRYGKLANAYRQILKEVWEEVDSNHVIRSKLSALASAYGRDVSEAIRRAGLDGELRRMAKKHKLGERYSEVYSKEAWREQNDNYAIRSKLSSIATAYGKEVSEAIKRAKLDAEFRRLARKHRLGEKYSEALAG